MLLTYNNNNILLCGDATQKNFNSFLHTINNNKLLSSNILKVAHHGSRANNTTEILNQLINVDKNISIISTDGGIRYKTLPSSEVINYIKQSGNAKVICTSELNEEIITPVLSDLGQTQELDEAIRTFTQPVKSANYDGYIKVTVHNDGSINSHKFDKINSEEFIPL